MIKKEKSSTCHNKIVFSEISFKTMPSRFLNAQYQDSGIVNKYTHPFKLQAPTITT